MPTPVPTRAQLLRRFAEDLLAAKGRHADEVDFQHLEAAEAHAWYTAGTQAFEDAAGALSGALDTTHDTPARAQWNRLLLAVLDDISADRLIELRDALRAALIDYARTDIRAELPPVLAKLVEQQAVDTAERIARHRAGALQ